MPRKQAEKNTGLWACQTASRSQTITDYGKLEQNNGDYFEGNWVNGQWEGYGKLIQNGSVYEGGFKDNKQDGEGKEIWPDGAKFEGHYEKGVKSGIQYRRYSKNQKTTSLWMQALGDYKSWCRF